jgi:hypothetical protein
LNTLFQSPPNPLKNSHWPQTPPSFSVPCVRWARRKEAEAARRMSRERRARIFEVASSAVMASVSGGGMGWRRPKRLRLRRSRIPFRNGWWRPWFGRLLCGTLASPHLTETGWRRHFSTRKLCLRIVPATGSFRDVGCAGGMVVADAIIRRRPVFLRLT